MKLISFFLQKTGSLILAVILLTILAALLAVTTFVEADYGAAVSSFFVYDSWLFYLLLFLLSLNVLCSMLARFPWKTRQLPFLTVHLGILVLLGGCYITAKGNREADLTILEGKSARFAVAKGYHFSLLPISFEKDGENATAGFSHSASSAASDLAQRREEERRTELAIPFRSGPFNWENYRREVWFDETPRSFRSLLWPLMQLASRDSGVIYSATKAKNPNLQADIRIEVLDYLSNSRKAPAGPLELAVQWGTNKAEAESGKAEQCQLFLTPQVGSYQGSFLELGIGAFHAFENGEQITFRVAESEAEVNAFLDSDPGEIVAPLGTLVVHLFGKKHVVPIEELLKKQAAFRPQLDEMRSQMSSLMRQRAAIRNAQTTPPPTGSANAENAPTTDAPTTDIPAAESQPASSVDGKSLKEADDAIAALFEKMRETQRQLNLPLGDSGWSLGLSQFQPEGPAFDPSGKGNADSKVQLIPTGPMVSLTLLSPGGQTDPMILLSGRPDLNAFGRQCGACGTYCFDPKLAAEKAVGLIPPAVLEQVDRPRLDLLQTPEGKLVYRTWKDGRFFGSGELPIEGSRPISLGTENDVVLTVMQFVPHDLPGYKIIPLPLEKNPTYEPEQRVRLRATFDGRSEEFWIRSQYAPQSPLLDPPEEDQVRVLQGDGRAFRLRYVSNELDLGFSLYLRKFTQKMDPGTKIAAHFSSLVDMRSAEETADRIDLVSPPNESGPFPQPIASSETIDVLREKVLIKMNQPGLFKDPKTGHKYRVYQSSRQGPFGPETPEFRYLYDKRILPGETRPRESLYRSVLSVNYDPGRGLKYLGSALLIFGTAWVFYGRRK